VLRVLSLDSTFRILSQLKVEQLTYLLRSTSFRVC
jgi:hypothetical protein